MSILKTALLVVKGKSAFKPKSKFTQLQLVEQFFTGLVQLDPLENRPNSHLKYKCRYAKQNLHITFGKCSSTDNTSIFYFHYLDGTKLENAETYNCIKVLTDQNGELKVQIADDFRFLKNCHVYTDIQLGRSKKRLSLVSNRQSMEFEITNTGFTQITKSAIGKVLKTRIYTRVR